ncbi:MAG TPA: outer membrane beta-barrel protein [Candidatus Sulfotelmatobacter sp.]|jgi:hypothetical protein
MRKAIIIAFMLAGFASLAAAQVPTSGNVYLGYAFYNTDLSSIDRANTNGWEASLEGKVFPHIGIVVDYNENYGSQNFPVNLCPGGICPATFNANFTERNILFGPRVSARVGKIRPFAEVLVGLGHVNANAAGSDTSFATAIGGGVDYSLIRLVSWRLQGDYVATRFFGTTQNNVRISTGIAVHF